MSIVPLEHVTLVGLSEQKERLLDDLHRFGALELIPLVRDSTEPDPQGPSSQSREALKFLLASPQRRRQVTDESHYDAAEVERRALEVQSQIRALERERDELLLRIEAARPWGDFRFPPPEALGKLRLWFYVVPHKDLPRFATISLPWEIVRRDHRFCYVVVLAESEPEALPAPRVHLGARSCNELTQRLEEVEFALEDAGAERAYLTRWCSLFARDLVRLEDSAARVAASRQTRDWAPLVEIQAWVPQENTRELAEYAAQNGLVFVHRSPRPDENPPTLMRNLPREEAGEDLVNFYMTPGYWTWDPSRVVLSSFALFFGMILADAGYAMLLGLMLLVFWRRLGRSEAGARFRPMLALIVLFSLVYGMLVGSYFGLAPSGDSLLGQMHWLDMNNSKLMMGLTILIGGLHVMLANVMDARRHAHWRDGLASWGWAAAVSGGLLFAGGSTLAGGAALKILGGILLVLGLLLVVSFTAPHEKPVQRYVQGLLGLTRISSAFGDILSYLRLFALGLASASLAVAFNDMAAGIQSAVPRLGLLWALLVLVLGHALNLLLGVSSGVIHGLRLNVIEFFNWGLKDEGRRFAPFRRKEGSRWT